MRRIDFLHTTHPYMGARKLAIMLQREGYSASRKIVRRLMEEMGICAVYPRANLSKRNFKESIVPYLLRGNRNIMVKGIDNQCQELAHIRSGKIGSFIEFRRKISQVRSDDAIDISLLIIFIKDFKSFCEQTEGSADEYPVCTAVFDLLLQEDSSLPAGYSFLPYLSYTLQYIFWRFLPQ